MMGRWNRLKCRECFRTKPGNYFISPTLCKKCAAKRRPAIYNPLIRTAEGVLITALALKKLQKMADAEVPRTFRYSIAEPIMMFISIGGTGAFWYYVWTIALPRGVGWLDGLALSVLSIVPLLVSLRVKAWLQAPRNREISERLNFLVQERQIVIEEAERFYASPEWCVLRERVIREQGKTCGVCLRRIRKQFDVTVDHIKPRMKFPSLALDISNLQVLCRSCNSKKGDRLFDTLS